MLVQLQQAVGSSLNDAAEAIAAAGAAGVSVDLEATAQGLGYGSFADAVSAYNAANGTNYTEAKQIKDITKKERFDVTADLPLKISERIKEHTN